MPSFRPLFLTLVSVVLTTAACHPDDDAHPREADAAPAPPERTLAHLGERFLVHVVHPPIVAGRSMSVLVHGTRLDDGTPITGGELALVLEGPGAARVRFTARERIPGHWPAEITVPARGSWRVVAEVRATGGPEDVPLGDLTVFASDAEAASAPAVEPPAGAIVFLFESQWPIAMGFERVVPRRITERLSVPGRVETPPGAEAHASTLVGGRLIAPSGGRLPRPGQRVAAGDVLARVETYLATSDLVGLQALEYQQHQLRHELDLQQLEAERALGESRVRIQSGKRALERAERLLEKTLGTQAELDAVRAELDLARAAENAALSSLDSVNRLRNEHAEDPGVTAPVFDILAPISGVVANVDGTLGESVEPGARIATILDLRTMWAVAEVPEHELGRLEGVSSARVLPRGLGAAIEAEGPPVHVAATVDPLSRCVDAAFAIPNADGRLRAGLLATFELATGARPGVLTVPEPAVAHEQGRPVVYVMADGETFVKRRVRLGGREGGRFEVLEGLAAGEVIAATGAEDLRLAALAGSGQIVEHHH